jgi:hypothetical protein
MIDGPNCSITSAAEKFNFISPPQHYDLSPAQQTLPQYYLQKNKGGGSAHGRDPHPSVLLHRDYDFCSTPPPLSEATLLPPTMLTSLGSEEIAIVIPREVRGITECNAFLCLCFTIQ